MRASWRWVVAGVGAAAAAARLALLAFPASPDLDLSYAVARHWGADPSNVVPPYSLQSALWWQRPLAYVLLGPAAALGSTPFRVAVALAASALPPLVALAVLRWRGRPAVAAVAGLVAALHPTLVQLGTDAWPATLAASFGLAAFLAHGAGRPAVAGLLAVAAAWSHPAGLLFAAAFFAVAVVQAARRGGARLYPLELDRAATGAAAALLLGIVPAAASWLFLGGAALAVTWTAAAVASTLFVALAPWLLVGGALAAGHFAGATEVRRAGSGAAVLAVVAAFAAAPFVPALRPATDSGLDAALAAMGPQPWDSVLLVDVDWRLVAHPFADHARIVGWSYTAVALPADDWIRAVEGSGHTVIRKEPGGLNLQLRLAYSPCIAYEDGLYAVLDGACTPGHGDALRHLMEGAD